MPAGTAASWFPIDSIEHFEFIDKGKIDTINGSTVTYRQTLTITSFDSGRWALPAFPLAIGNKAYLTDSLPVSVAYSNFDAKQDFHDIKDILEVETRALSYINWILLGIALLCLLAITWLLRKKVARPAAPVASKPLSKLLPLQEALQALEALEKDYAGNTMQAKTYHTTLNDILRWYLYRKAGIATMEKTSGELMLQLSHLNLPPAGFTALAQVLRMSDAVKFAKYQPATAENEAAADTIKKSIEQLDTIIT